MNQGNPPPNWYPDPKGEAELRYWDGSQWTEHTHSGQTAAQPAPAAPPPSAAPPPQSPPPAASEATAPGAQPTYQQPQQPGYATPPPTAGPGPSAGSSGGGLGKKLPMILGGVLALVAVGVILALVLGGGDDGPTEEDKVKETAEEIITTTEASACTELATRAFVQKLTGESGAAAISTCEQNTEAFGDGAEITKTEITGDRAEVEAKVEGGDADGETLEMILVKQQDDWKIDELARVELTQGPEAEQAVRNTVLNFGSSEGPKACQYLSYSGLQRLGGKSGCEDEFKEATAANYTVDEATVSAKTATVLVTETRQGKTIQFKLAHEAGNWKIESFEQQ